ncbi:30S ribosomal protein S3 [bacterium]|nr:30S ribosomal protein S3 [bacterium]
MGQKTNPIGLRLGIIKYWNSKWFARKQTYRRQILEDLQIRRYTRERLDDADVSNIEIIRSPKKVTINIYTARPGVVIGKSGIRIETFKKELEHLTSNEIQINVLEIRRPELDAFLVAKNIAKQIEGRVSCRRAMKSSIRRAMRMGAKGIKIICSGRLAGAEIARSEGYKEGRIPLHTFRADIDYATVTAHTTAGCVGVKVWIFIDEILGGMEEYWDNILDKKKKKRRRKK